MPAADGAGMRTLTAAAIAAIVISAFPIVAPAPTAMPDIPQIAEAGRAIEPTAEIAVASWARGRFADAGLDLPTIDVEVGEDRDDCGGNTAIAVHTTSTPRIVLCMSSTASNVVEKRTVLHEMAHIWARAHVDSATRDAFIAMRGVPSWDDEPRWDLRGSEHAAEIITWALMDGEIQLLTLAEHDPTSLAAGYELLTGSLPPAER